MSRKRGKHFDNQKEIRRKGKVQNKKNKTVFPLFRIVSVIIILVCVFYIAIWLKGNSDNNKMLERAHSAVTLENIDGISKIVSVDFEALKQINSDTVGWIKVNNTKVDYPVVQTGNNSYYLNHSFDKSYNVLGWVFMDYRIDENETDKNITIYGHNAKNGSMFASLKDILKEEWYSNEENLNVLYVNEEGSHTYKVFSIYQIEEETYYTNNFFSSDAEYEEFIDVIKGRSIVDFRVDVTKDDQILTLSTCANNNKYRVVLHAKKII